MHKRRSSRKFLIFFTFLTVISGCVNIPHHELKSVPSGHLYNGEYINVRVPNSDGWHLVNSSSAGMEFAKSGVEGKGSFAAQVLIFPLQKTEDRSDFLALIKTGIDADTDSTRFNIKSLNFNYTEKRDYPCVHVKSDLEDKKAITSLRHRESLVLQMSALYCRHPVKLDTGFAIIYSYRGPTTYPSIGNEAKGFIDGVQVPRIRINGVRVDGSMGSESIDS